MAVEELGGLALELDAALGEAGFAVGSGLLEARVGEGEDDLAVEEMDGLVAPGDDPGGVPLPVRLLWVEWGGDAFPREDRVAGPREPKDALLARAFAAVRNRRVILEDDVPAFDVAVGTGDAPPLADALLHDVVFDAPHPRVGSDAVRADGPVEDAGVAVMAGFVAGCPLRGAPLVLDPDVDVGEGSVGGYGATFTGHVDGGFAVGLGDREDVVRVVVRPEGLLGGGVGGGGG